MKKIILVSAVLWTVSAYGAMAAVVKATLQVENMTCAACPYTITKVLQSVDGVREVSVDSDKKTADVTFDDSKTSLDVLTKTTGDAGYPSKVKSN